LNQLNELGNQAMLPVLQVHEAVSFHCESASSHTYPNVQEAVTYFKPLCAQMCTMTDQNAELHGNGNGLLFHMTQPISRSTIKAIACSKPTISEH